MKTIKYLILFIPIFLNNMIKNFNRWVFSYGTRVIEVFNSWWLMGFGIVMMSSHTTLITQYPYREFEPLSIFWVWFGVFIVGVAQFIMMCRTCNRSSQFSGIILQLSGIIWIVIAIFFGFDYPPISTALPIYLGMGIATGLTGLELLNRSKEKEAKHGV